MISRQVEIGNKIELTKKNSLLKREKPLFSQIQDINLNNEIVITTPIESGKIIPLGINEEFIFCVYTSKGLYKCDVQVINRKREENMFFATLKIMTKMQKHQRREYFRLNCVLNFKFKEIDQMEEWTNGIVLDISGGGFRFTSSKELITGTQIISHIELIFDDEIKLLQIKGTVIDSILNTIGTNNYETRINFGKIKNEDRELVIRFIFEEQRKRRKKEKGM